MKPFYLHPGMGKTATTTLQDAVFRQHPDICYLGKSLRNKGADGSRIRKGYRSPELATVFTRVLKQEGERGPIDADAAARLLAEAAAEQPDSRIFLASWEGLAKRKPEHFRGMLNHLQVISPDVRVLFTIRNQLDWMKSAYLQWLGSNFREALSNPGRPPFLEFEQWHRLQRKRWRGILPPTYHNIRTARELLGPEKVGVVCFETVRTGIHNYFAQIAGFLAIDSDKFVSLGEGQHANPSISAGQLELMRKLNGSRLERFQLRFGRARYYKEQFKSLEGTGGKAKVSVRPDLERDLIGAAGEENADLARELGLDLGGLGYHHASRGSGP